MSKVGRKNDAMLGSSTGSNQPQPSLEDEEDAQLLNPPPYEEEQSTTTSTTNDTIEPPRDDYINNSQPNTEAHPRYVPNPLSTGSEDDNDYGTGLFACHESIPICLTATFIPCWSWGTIRVALNSGNIEVGVHDEGHEASWRETLQYSAPYIGLATVQALLATVTFVPLTNVAQMFTRFNLRKKYGMEPHHIRDTCSHFFCPACALAQDHREMVRRERNIRGGYFLAQLEQEDSIV